jgi:hypothetical protein
MSIREELRDATQQFRLLSLYQRFEHIVVLFLTALIAVVIVAALWTLSLKILFGLVLSGSLDPSDYSAFQAVFGMILTVIIALEFKKSLLVMAERRGTIVQIRSVVMNCTARHLPKGHHSRSHRNRRVVHPGIRSRDLRARHCLLADWQSRSARR